LSSPTRSGRGADGEGAKKHHADSWHASGVPGIGRLSRQRVGSLRTTGGVPAGHSPLERGPHRRLIPNGKGEYCIVMSYSV
jgi:hypothetical protein